MSVWPFESLFLNRAKHLSHLRAFQSNMLCARPMSDQPSLGFHGPECLPGAPAQPVAAPSCLKPCDACAPGSSCLRHIRAASFGGRSCPTLFSERVVPKWRALSIARDLAASGLCAKDGVDHVPGAAHPQPACAFARRKVLLHPTVHRSCHLIHDDGLPQIFSSRADA